MLKIQLDLLSYIVLILWLKNYIYSLARAIFIKTIYRLYWKICFIDMQENWKHLLLRIMFLTKTIYDMYVSVYLVKINVHRQDLLQNLFSLMKSIERN